MELAVTSVFGFVLLSAGEFVASKPVIRLCILRDRQFAGVFAMNFLNQATTSSVDAKCADGASGLVNAARNLGGSIGLAVIATDGAPEVATALIECGMLQPAAVASVTSAPPPARWWEGVGDDTLTQLIDDAFAASPTLAAPVACVRWAPARQAQNRAALGPSGGASGRRVRSRMPTGSFTCGSASGGDAEGGAAAGGSSGTSTPDPIENDSDCVTANASWKLDLFGRRRRDIENSTAAVAPMWNFLSIPTTRARIAGAEAGRDASLADYQRSVLAALQDTNDSLSRFGRQRQAVAQRDQARALAARAASIFPSRRSQPRPAARAPS